MTKKRFLVLLVWSLAASTTVRAQTPQDELLVRMERARPHDDVCMLLNRSGAYRLEWVYAAKTEVYIGTLSAASVAGLEERLNKEELRRLSQEQIISPPISDTWDRIAFDIRREHRWQALKFPGPESRKPFAAFLDPLINWFEDVAGEHPGAVLVNTGASRCVPPDERVLKAAQTERDSRQFVMRIQVNHPCRRGCDTNLRDCVPRRPLSL